MARVNITVPDDVLDRARAERLNVSRVAAAALSEELDRRARVAALDVYLRELETELGPVPPREQVAAEKWAASVLDDHGRSARDETSGRSRASSEASA